MSQRVTSLKMIIGIQKYNKIFQHNYSMNNSQVKNKNKDNSKN